MMYTFINRNKDYPFRIMRIQQDNLNMLIYLTTIFDYLNIDYDYHLLFAIPVFIEFLCLMPSCRHTEEPKIESIKN